MVITEVFGVYNVDGAATAGGITVRASRLAVPVSTGSKDSVVVGTQAVAVPRRKLRGPQVVESSQLRVHQSLHFVV